jgi:adenylosuccinate lyase
MNLNSLTAVSPIDGRYHNKTKDLQKFFSEFGLIKYRVLIEIQYFIDLSKLKIKGLEDFPQNRFDELKSIFENFDENDALWIKETEKVTNHDVKAVEYFLKEKMNQLQLSTQSYKEKSTKTKDDISKAVYEAKISSNNARKDAYANYAVYLQSMVTFYQTKATEIEMRMKAAEKRKV